jgi:thymidine kinase
MSLEIVVGSMFSGKTTYVYNFVKDNPESVVVNHSFDDRYGSTNDVVTHDGKKTECITTKKLRYVVDELIEHPIICIDEAQFFDDLYDIVLELVDTYNKRVIIVGLDGDSERKPFGQILRCIPIADSVVKLKSVCNRCGNPGLFSFRHSNATTQVLVGGVEKYSPLCRRCYINDSKPPN